MPVAVRRKTDPPDPAGARNAALRALGRREHSAAQLKRKLSARGYEDEVIDGTVDDLADRGWQSDARYAEMLVRGRSAQGYGKLYIESQLRVAGVPDAEIAAAFAAVDCDWTQAAVALHARKFGAAPASYEERIKQHRYLAARGFSGDQIRAALKGVVADDE